jgi:hypothetical protein
VVMQMSAAWLLSRGVRFRVVKSQAADARSTTS